MNSVGLSCSLFFFSFLFSPPPSPPSLLPGGGGISGDIQELSGQKLIRSWVPGIKPTCKSILWAILWGYFWFYTQGSLLVMFGGPYATPAIEHIQMMYNHTGTSNLHSTYVETFFFLGVWWLLLMVLGDNVKLGIQAGASLIQACLVYA